MRLAQRRRRRAPRYASASSAGAHTNHASTTAARTERLVATPSSISTAGYPSKCGIVKKPPWLGPEHRLLLAEVLDADSENRLRRGRLITEALEVGLAEPALPGEGLAAHRPCATAVLLALDDFGQLERDAGGLVQRHHARTLRRPSDSRQATLWAWSSSSRATPIPTPRCPTCCGSRLHRTASRLRPRTRGPEPTRSTATERTSGRPTRRSSSGCRCAPAPAAGPPSTWCSIALASSARSSSSPGPEAAR